MNQDRWVAGVISLFVVILLGSFLIDKVSQAAFLFFNPDQTGILVVLQFVGLTLTMLIMWFLLNQNYQVRYFQLVLIVGVILRLMLIPIEPYTSNDVDRYLFDGRILLEGLDPYRINHEAPELAALRDQWQPPDEHAAYPTLYPPLALSLFALAAIAGPEWSEWVWKVMVSMASIASLLLMAKLLLKRGLEKHLPLFALSPILLIEGGIGVHIDAFSTLFVVAALYFWFLARWWLCGIFIALGALCKILPLVLIGPIFLVAPNGLSKLRLCMGFLSVVALAYGGFFLFGLFPFGSIAVFFEKWRFGSPLFNALEWGLSPSLLAVVIPILTILIMALVAASLFFSTPEQKQRRALYGMQWTVAAPLLFSPVVFPWYLMIMVPLVTLAPSAAALAWLAAVPLTYEVLGQFICCGHWAPASWPLWCIVFAILFGGSLDLIRRRSCSV